jgi:hypothetical protein
MTRAASTRLQFNPDLSICRVLNGMWQVSGAHGDIEPVGVIAETFAYHDAGFTPWDLADHYGPAEDFIGTFRCQFAARHGVERLSEIQAFTNRGPRIKQMGWVEATSSLGLARCNPVDDTFTDHDHCRVGTT